MHVRSRLRPGVIFIALVNFGGCDSDAVDAEDAATTTDAAPRPPECATWEPGPCLAGEGRLFESAGGDHIAAPTAITWTEDPPSSGPHRPQWARWGEYDALSPAHWLHNLEHGGAVLLYHPCASDDVIDALRELAQNRPPDDGGPFRWVLAPHPDLISTVAVMTWQWRYLAPCVQPDEIDEFLDRHYRGEEAPEDIASDGSHTEGWLGR